MSNSNWGYPNTVWFGNGRINKLPKACNILNIKKPLLVTDKDLAKTLSKNFSSSAIDNVKILSFGMNNDIHASADYRANMVRAFTKKAVDAC